MLSVWRSPLLQSITLALTVFAAASVAEPAIAQTALQTPEQFFGFRMGADRKLANWDRLLAYYRTLAQSTDRMKLVDLGKSSEGRPYIALFISSPANLARLDALRQFNATLADPRGATTEAVDRAVKDGARRRHPDLRASLE